MLKMRKGDGPKVAALCVLILATVWFIYHQLAQVSPRQATPRVAAPDRSRPGAVQAGAQPQAGKPMFAARPEVGAGLVRVASVPDPFQPVVADGSPAASSTTTGHSESTVLKPPSSPPLPKPAAPAELPNLRLVGIITNPSPLAVLQEGDDRRLVRPGESLADGWRVASVTPRDVTLVKASRRVTLRLGADQKRPSGRLSPLRPS